MRLLRADTDDLILETVHDESKKYAIFSHRWLEEEEEVTYADIVHGKMKMGSKAGWKKLNWCRQQALKDGLQYIWADTVCIDKSSSQELTEFINSMYRWYEKAECCYVYLHDMPDQEPLITITEEVPHDEMADNGVEATGSGSRHDVPEEPISDMPAQVYTDFPVLEGRLDPYELDLGLFDSSQPLVTSPSTATTNAKSKALEGWDRKAFENCAWFTRAWTLPEMIAPSTLRFYNTSWTLIGELGELAHDVSKITGVHVELLTKQRPLASYSIAQKISWAAARQASKIEDRAYSLLGLLDVAMGNNYGEGRRSFQRLQEEVLRTSSDDSIFAFESTDHVTIPCRSTPESYGQLKLLKATTLLAESPEAFRNCSNIAMSGWRTDDNQYQMVTKEINFRMRTIDLKPDFSFSSLFTKPKEVLYRQAVLQCCLEEDPSTMILLNLFSLPERPDTFYVNAENDRISKLRIYGKKKSQCTSKSFSIVRTPIQADVNSAVDSAVILCTCKTSDMALRLVYASLPNAWHAQGTAFMIPKKDGKFVADLGLFINGSYLSPIQLSANVHYRRFEVKFGTRSIWLPTWTTSVLRGNRYNCSVTYSRGRFLIARAFPEKRLLGHIDVPLLEIEHVGGVWFSLLVVFRVVLTLILICVSCLTLLATLFLIPQFFVVFGFLWHAGGISWWEFLLAWSGCACAWSLVLAAVMGDRRSTIHESD